jgi:uncharacterized membrane protein
MAPIHTSAKNATLDKLLPFAICFLAYAALCFATLFVSQHLIHVSMVWNLFLAFLPLVFVGFLGQKKTKNGVLLALWLLFLPNAFYVLTDFIHISDLTYFVGGYYDFKNVDYAKDAVVYLELINIALGYLLALLMGLMSLKIVHQTYIKKQQFLILSGIFLLVGYAIYIGRFLRLNSWDVLLPVKLLERVGASFNLFGLMMTLLFAGYVALVYFGFRFLTKPQSH